MVAGYLKKLRIKKPVIIYPVLLVILFILTRINISEVNPELRNILLFFAGNMVALLLVFRLLNMIMKDRLKAWLVDFLIFTFILFYYKIKIPVSHLPEIDKIYKTVYHSRGHFLDIFLFILLLAFSILILKYKGPLARFSQYLNLLVAVLILYQLFTIGRESNSKISLAARPEMIAGSDKITTESLPDIYYIILDAYTSSNSLKEYWNFGNDNFLDFLNEKGFLITTDSRANYNMTPYSLASSLNLAYLKNIPHTYLSAAQARNLYDLVDSSCVVKTLLKSDYQVVNYSSFDFHDHPKYYKDVFFIVKRNLVKGTFYEAIAKRLNKHWFSDQNTGLLSIKSVNLNILNELSVRKNNPGKPVFVFAHIIMPHEPYFFDESGIPQETDSALNYLSKDRYLAQLKFLNKIIQKTISSIIENNTGKLPVIIIQGDHGWRYLLGENQVKESSTIFNAYFFPDHDYSKLYSSVSPVNTFRVLFNKYLGGNLEILPDTTYNVFIF